MGEEFDFAKMFENEIPGFVLELIRAGTAEEYQRELDRFKNDVKAHGIAAKLLLREYPLLWKMHISRHTDYHAFMDDVEPGLKQVYLDYVRLVEDVKKTSASLYDEEIAASRRDVFGKQRPPKSIREKKAQLVRVQEEDIADDYIESVQSLDVIGSLEKIRAMVANVTKYREALESMLKMDALMRTAGEDGLPKGMTQEEMKQLMNSPLPDLDSSPFSELGPFDKGVVEQVTNFNNRFWGNIEKLDKTFKKYFDGIVESFVACIQDIDSLNQHIVRFLARLVHIQRFGNRSYEGIERVDSDLDRVELKSFMRSFERKYSALGGFISSYFKFNVLRVSSAHLVADARLSDDGSEIVINRVGKPPLVYNTSLLNKRINSYVELTSALPLFMEETDGEAFFNVTEFTATYLGSIRAIIDDLKRIEEIQAEMERRFVEDEAREERVEMEAMNKIIERIHSGENQLSDLAEFIKKHPNMAKILKAALERLALDR
jgi:hypothetical protein